ncbi:MAG: DUF4153 domain-containing protein [Bdellovibrionota bacterium]
MKITDRLFHWIPQASASARRFPLTVLASVGAWTCVLILISNPDTDLDDKLWRQVWAFALGISLAIAIESIPLEKIRARFKANGDLVIRGLLYAAGLSIWLAAIFIPASADVPKAFLLHVRYMQCALAFHLAVAISPFIFSRDERAFWNYNRAIFERAILTVVYTGLLAGGISVALMSLEWLFDVKVDWKWFAGINAFIAFPVSVLFFLAGRPSDPHATSSGEYPRSLRILVPNVAFPLITVYLVILYAYTAKILVTSSWPRGLVGWLVSYLSLVIVLAQLLGAPLTRETGASFARWMMKHAYKFLLPLLLVLFAALWKRLSQYGITEPRYVLLVLGFWMFCISIAYSGWLTKGRAVSFFWSPATLLSLTAVTAIGPWSLISASIQSQTTRLERVLESLGTNVDGDKIKFERTPAFADKKAISSAIEFLCKHDEQTYLESRFKVKPQKDDRKDGNSKYVYSRGDQCETYLEPPIFAKLGFSRIYRYETEESAQSKQRSLSWNSPPNKIAESAHYRVVNVQRYWSGSSVEEQTGEKPEEGVFVSGTKPVQIKWRTGEANPVLTLDGTETIPLDFTKVMAKLNDEKGADLEVQALIEFKTSKGRGALRLEEMWGTKKEGSDVFEPHDLKATVFLPR